MAAKLVVQRFDKSNGLCAIGFRLLAEEMPSDAGEFSVDLSRDEHGGCMVPITLLWGHDTHSQLFDEAAAEKYIARVASHIAYVLDKCTGTSKTTGIDTLDLAGIVPKTPKAYAETVKPKKAKKAVKTTAALEETTAQFGSDTNTWAIMADPLNKTGEVATEPSKPKKSFVGTDGKKHYKSCCQVVFKKEYDINHCCCANIKNPA